VGGVDTGRTSGRLAPCSLTRLTRVAKRESGEPEPPAVSRGAGSDRVLLMETVDVDEVLATVRRARTPLAPGVAAKVPRAKLLAYLEREGVAVTHTSSRRARTTRTRF
jgi:hypothetical protein